MNNPLISVTVPTFKKQYLKDCIESVLAQDYGNYELVVVDDNSPEDIESVVKQYKDSRLRYYKNENGFGGYNVVGNWNRCLELAKGDYMICMGDDDMLRPNCLSLYAKAINDNPEFDVFHIRTEIINENNEVSDLQEPRPEIESMYSMIWNLWKGRDQFIGDFLFKSKPLRDKGGFYFLPYAWSSDKITAYLAAGAKGICNINTVGFSYRRTSITISNSCNTQRERYIALLGEKEWYKQMVENAKSPVDEMEQLYFKLIRNGYESYMQRYLDGMVMWDIAVSPSHWWYWLKKKKEYGFSMIFCLQIIKSSLGACSSKLLRMIFHHY